MYTDTAGEAEIRAAFPQALAEPVEAGWEDRWKAFHRPARAGGLWIGPPWEPPPADEPTVVVDPGRAFGTGAHPTTRACIELLARLERGSLLDAGCGSGVLAVAAARLGFAPVFAVDADPVAVEVCAETVRSNGVDVEVASADVLRDELHRTDVAVANIELARRRGAARPHAGAHGDHLRLSGVGDAARSRLGAGRPTRARGLGCRRSRQAALS